MQDTPAGWYPAVGDPPNTVRWWDGGTWVGEPTARPAGTTAAGSVGARYPETSQATTALVLGILGIVACGVLAPVAWKVGNDELKAIDAGRRDPTNRSNANAGRICGIVGTLILATILLFFIGILVLGGVLAVTES